MVFLVGWSVGFFCFDFVFMHVSEVKLLYLTGSVRVLRRELPGLLR